MKFLILRDCKKSKNETAKCANCGGNHTANWKGCPIYKEKIAAAVKPKTTAVQRVQQKPITTIQAMVSKQTTEPAPVRRSEQQQLTQKQSPPEKKEVRLEDIMKYLQKMDSRISRLENKLAQTEKTKPKKT